MTHLRLTYLVQGGHIHCQLRSATSETTTHALNGSLVFDEREWPDVLAAFSKIAEVLELPGLDPADKATPRTTWPRRST